MKALNANGRDCNLAHVHDRADARAQRQPGLRCAWQVWLSARARVGAHANAQTVARDHAHALSRAHENARHARNRRHSLAQTIPSFI